MKYCGNCKVKVNTDFTKCPLCAMDINEAGDEAAGAPECKEPAGDIQNPHEKYPQMEIKLDDKYNFTVRLLLLLSIAFGSASIIINLMTYAGVLWSLVAIGTILFLWGTVAYPLLAKRNIGRIIILDVISISVYISIIDIIMKTKGWTLTYAIPFLFTGATLTITFIMILKRLKWREYTVYQTVMIILGFLPVISCIFSLVSVHWPSVVSAFYSFLTFIGMYIFYHKKYQNELKKRFHL